MNVDSIRQMPHGILVADLHLAPDENQDMWTLNLELPEFTDALYYAPFQKHAINPDLDLWPEAYNQCHPLPVSPSDIHDLKRGGMFLLLRLTSGSFVAILPIVSTEVMTWLQGTDSGLALAASHFGHMELNVTAPLLAVAENTCPYAAVRDVWGAARKQLDSFHLREEKALPEVFRYLGWCTWEQYRDDISESLILEAIDSIEREDLPIRWVLIDDGHLQISGAFTSITADGGAEAPDDAQDRKLAGFQPDLNKFPHGWERIQNRIRQSKKIKWSGIWLNFNGYWGGIASENNLGAINQHLCAISEVTKLPKSTAEDAGAFYDAWIRQQAESGFNFIKVDNESQNVPLYRGSSSNAVRAANVNHQALEDAVEKHLDGMINCMAHSNLCAFNARFSQVTRCSEDYAKEDLWRAKHHLHNSFGNMLWMGQTIWGDHDMFHSSDPVAGAVMARSKAISGGPVYLSDASGDFDPELVRPLCLSSGRILMPLAPAVPVPSSLFVDPYEADAAFCVIAPLVDQCAVWAAYNLTSPEKSVSAVLRMEDYSAAGALIDENWEAPAEGLIVWDEVSQTCARMLAADPEGLSFSLKTFSDIFLLLSPVFHGWAVIGLRNKYLAPQACHVHSRGHEYLELSCEDAGKLLIWKQADSVACEEGEVVPVGEHLWEIQLRKPESRVTLRL